jgi:2-keto-4-pentenoate hydratase/2-oxohepta-3-ene-1,7-dioic acid hydratase in catechol pathway
MRLVTFETATVAAGPGVLIDGDAAIVGLQTPCGSSETISSMQELIDGGPAALEQATRAVENAHERVVHSVEDCRLLAPLPTPAQIRDCMSFEKHAVNAPLGAARYMAAKTNDPEATFAAIEASGQLALAPVWYDIPLYYKANRFGVVGTETDIPWPNYSSLRDFELELAVVVSRRGVDIQFDDAEGHIFGYTIYNDFSARDAQMKEMPGGLGPAKGKDFDHGIVLGPCIVTRDELPLSPDGKLDLKMTATVNGEVWGRGTSADMRHTFPAIIAHISQCETLHPGEVIGSGTVGDGCGLEHGRFLHDGDVVELEIEQIGKISNTIAVKQVVD